MTPKKPLGRGHSRYGRQPMTLKESLAFREAQSFPKKGKTILKKERMTDKRWDGNRGWVKKSYNINGVEVHYVYNTRTGQVDDFKIKD